MNLFYTDGRLAGAVDGAHFVWEAAKGGSGKVGLRLTSYNLALYLTAILAVDRVDPRTRLGWGVAGLPLLFLWQVGDTLVAMESQWLTLSRPEAYEMSAGIDPWFLMVKVANNLNVLAGRQLVPFAIVGAHWWRWHAENQVREGFDLDRSHTQN